MKILAWHFVGDKLRNGDPVPPDGKWLEYCGDLIMCKSGLHASRDPFDALKHAPGPILCSVECDGEIIEDKDKLVCSKRKIIRRLDATAGLRYFARMQALSVAHLWDPPDIVLDFLMSGDNVDAARDAAWDAAWVWDMARDAAWTRNAAWAWNAAWAQNAAQANHEITYPQQGIALNATVRLEWNELVYEAFRS
jgi:hypothetical protein